MKAGTRWKQVYAMRWNRFQDFIIQFKMAFWDNITVTVRNQSINVHVIETEVKTKLNFYSRNTEDWLVSCAHELISCAHEKLTRAHKKRFLLCPFRGSIENSVMLRLMQKQDNPYTHTGALCYCRLSVESYDESREEERLGAITYMFTNSELSSREQKVIRKFLQINKWAGTVMCNWNESVIPLMFINKIL